MDGIDFDRITKTLTSRRARRQTLTSLLGGVLLAVAAPLGLEAARKKKKPCRKLSQSCWPDGPKLCCGQQEGLSACEVSPRRACGTGHRCCTFETMECNPDHGDCDCCGGLHCGFIGFLGWRCLQHPRANSGDVTVRDPSA